ncbi:MAG TPA: NTP transferase domain-containing protein [Microbacteriaceae bacterium]|nr:NTP transferase domain-containing protein [Microbacteriaceae bacterium]
MPSAVTVVINAAGIGSRLDYGLPKCLVPILGRPLISWQLDLLGDHEVVVVAGFRARDVAAHLRSERPDVPIVLNHEFRSTGTAASLRLGARLAQDWVLSLDGDLLVAPEDLTQWLEGGEPLVGVSPRTTTNAVGVTVEDGLATSMGFDVDSPVEWNGLLRMPAEEVRAFGPGHVFESVQGHLPIRVAECDTVEVDHPQDLERASTWLAARTDESRTAWTS